MSHLPAHSGTDHYHHHHHPDHHHRHYAHHRLLIKQMIGVYSEAGKLDAVLMHRPGRELERLTPENKDLLLFDNIPNTNETHKSHDAFAETLRKNNVTVFYVLDLLRETLEHSTEAITMLIDGIIKHSDHPPEVSDALIRFLRGLTPTRLAHTVVEGLASTEDEIGNDEDIKSVLLNACSTENLFLIPPLSNLLFTRDSFSIMENSVFIWRMAKPARRNEPLIMRVIFSFPTPHAHISLKGIHVVDWETHADPSATVEGGDVAYLGHSKLLIGNGERTNRAGIQAIERTGLFHQVIAVELPENRDYMHLDTVLSSVGLHSFICHSNLIQKLAVYTVQTPSEGVQTEWLMHGHDVRKALRHLLCDPNLKFYDAVDESTSVAEQHQCRDNMLCLSDQNVVTYAGGDPDKGVIHQLEHDGLRPCHVDTFPYQGLLEGCGGAHCMTNALHRLRK